MGDSYISFDDAHVHSTRELAAWTLVCWLAGMIAGVGVIVWMM